MALAVGACAQFPERPETADTPPAAIPEDGQDASVIVTAARNTLGTPYRYGGDDPAGFDCSGLVRYTHARAGLSVPRTVARQQAVATPVDADALRPGDLVFFRLSGWKPSHVGIYVGQGRFIHAPSSGGQVRYDHLQERFWTRHFDSAGRFHDGACCDQRAAR
ncbi:C40 family peptidase [Ectothiorhodospiraceae bacterium WFHF3C12]|nr:C40 family peptidase [Ectothiorhodospiraceae bacterium WFHF3C12]